MKIFIVSDNKKLSKRLKNGLERKGFLIDLFFETAKAVPHLSIYQKRYALIIIDLSVSGIDNSKILHELRLLGIKTPVIFLANRSIISSDKNLIAENEKVDYLYKPFGIEDLALKINSLLPKPEEQKIVMKFGPLSLFVNTKKLCVNDVEIPLTIKEYVVLKFLMQNPDQVLSREEILHHIWHYDFNPRSNIVDVHIKNLRKKLGSNKGKEVIETIWGFGYRFNSKIFEE